MSFSPSAIKLYTTCREAYRYRYVEGIVKAEESIHLAWGKVIHKIPEGYWGGLTPLLTESSCLTEAESLVDPMALSSKNRTRWLGLMDSLSFTVDLYFEHHGAERDTTKPLMLEQAFDHEGVKGRIDQFLRCGNELELRELKTASEIVTEEIAGRFGFSDNMRKRWRDEYREQLLRNTGLLVYDWYLCQMAKHPTKVSAEVIIKPFRGKDPSIEMFDLTEEIISYRERTVQQIKLITNRMGMDTKFNQSIKPWEMSESSCFTKFGTCDYLPLCNHGVSKDTLKLYKRREIA